MQSDTLRPVGQRRGGQRRELTGQEPKDKRLRLQEGAPTASSHHGAVLASAGQGGSGQEILDGAHPCVCDLCPTVLLPPFHPRKPDRL